MSNQVTKLVQSDEIKITDLVKTGKVKFLRISQNEVWYKLDCEKGQYQFSIPIDETRGGTFEDAMRAMPLMRWIRKALEKGELLQIA